MDKQYALKRNQTEEFARRVRKNLDFIIRKRREGEDVHEVTQLVISLLALIVFPWEDRALKHLESLTLQDLEAKGWPRWTILKDDQGDTATLGKLIRHLRNAVSHRRIKFSSDNQEMRKVEIVFEDAPPPYKLVNWKAKINAADLKKFCDYFAKELEALVG